MAYTGTPPDSCGGWVLMHAGPGCRKAGQYHEQEGQEATASHDMGQAKAEPADDNLAHASTQVCVFMKIACAACLPAPDAF